MSNTSPTSAFNLPIVWHPAEGAYDRTRLAGFQIRSGCASREQMVRRAQTDPNWFWSAVLADLGIVFHTRPDCTYRAGNDPTRPEWCPGGKMNITESCVDRWVLEGKGDQIAVTAESEDGHKTALTYTELLDQVERASLLLYEGGVRPGDVVALMLTMTPDLVVAFLAVIRCGAIVLPLFSGFGPGAIAARLQESGARFAILDAYSRRRGKDVALWESFHSALTEPGTLQCVWVRGSCPLVSDGPSAKPTGAASQPRWQHWPSLTVPHVPSGSASTRPSFKAKIVDAEDSALLIFTSGTTGKPKGAVHTHCGFPVKAAQDMQHCMDLGQGDVLHWITDIGWMMGPWAIFGTLINGMTLALFDGAPDFPDAGRLWRFVEEHHVSFLGISPTFARLCQANPSAKPTPSQVNRLRAVGSTGSPWDTSSWQWTFEHVLGKNKPIINYSGGTEVSGGILSGNVYSPLKPCAFSGPVIGMDAAVMANGNGAAPGETGELVIRNHWIGMTRGFWNSDPRYFSTYWAQNSGVWTHGDRCFVDQDGQWFIVGRSDDTIKIAGKRLGPAEVETLIAQDPRVKDSAAIGVPDPIKGECLVIFCVPEDLSVIDNASARTAIGQGIKERITQELGKPMAPQAVVLTHALPKTRNAKTIHRMCRAVYLGEDPGDTSSLENPSALDDLRRALIQPS
jgi:acetyl-CoA synthetase